MEDHEICSIIISENDFSYEYTFYEDGIIRLTCLKEDGTTEWIKKEQISTRNKDRLVRLCPEEQKEKVMLILNYP
ncbi:MULTISPECIES: hypothetical protein [Chryseobacterium]|uniref:Uncharacterized protein n=1 Tax=Chryseobacterium camelliae TaxID=1265445 RepID=A0ABU0TFP6_9FLAO|nr:MULTISPECIES: hypothetical protein [Chryseobacterium]MDT3407119.1 hypothetical protein [Pseudacidovorax intermedius]MDQ1095090.1 hypothetical protein [Chryseobacterium camelliae]MDQ1099028.1 hypothetical protein [Chryseobacterium sp. SORGH_AS_1048]MDR6086376.1 hypothetical protein [Chryseobacterium sp. SORGH_AS_0909]MDR6130749.1 hypothetical protein [Chryseobacterium sp. SORGH_AS_1175]